MGIGGFSQMLRLGRGAAEAGAGSLQGARDGRGTGVEHGGDLGGGGFEHLAQDEDGPLAWPEYVRRPRALRTV